ncbi:hypothetical protein F5B18DRAFT_638254 [Nemania serpens]|nr:hypothetical protein F5B18DRAFT_638254 [Nemania serpens]
MIDFESASFGDKATDKLKKEDIRRIKDFDGDMFTIQSKDDYEDIPYVSNFFDWMDDDEISWTDDSGDESDQEDHSMRCSCPLTPRNQDLDKQTTSMS